MHVGEALLVGGAGLLAGTVNAIAGGGTLVSFPALLATGMGAVTANITSSVGLLSGYAGGSVAYRRELDGQGHRARSLAIVSILGGVIGAVTLLLTPSTAFRHVVPYLILLSCVLLSVQPRLARLVAQKRGSTPEQAGEITWPVRIGVGIGAIYGSYFGAGLGVLLLGVLGILLNDALQRLNALKGLLSLVVNLVGVAVFVASGQVAWAFAGILAATAYAGGALGVVLARRLSPQVLRGAVVTLGVVVAVLLLLRS